jgi:hypothetical protein
MDRIKNKKELSNSDISKDIIDVCFEVIWKSLLPEHQAQLINYKLQRCLLSC